MSDEQSRLKRERLWRSGNRTLLRELGVSDREVIMCRGLAWLLTTDGWHGLGSAFLAEVAELLGVDAGDLEKSTVVTEEVKPQARADIIVRTPAITLVLEAKINAGEGPRQADRIASEWKDEEPHLVFLTQDGSAPLTARDSASQWATWSWLDLARAGRAAIRTVGTDGVAPGAIEFIETLELEGGPKMAHEDVKMDFYLKHRGQIQEWSALHDRAVNRLNQALRNGVSLYEAGTTTKLWLKPDTANQCIAELKLADLGVDAGYLELYWEKGALLQVGAKRCYPQLNICSRPDNGPGGRTSVMEASRAVAERFSMQPQRNQWWIWSLSLEPDQPLTDLDEYTNFCVAKWIEVWELLAPALAKGHQN